MNKRIIFFRVIFVCAFALLAHADEPASAGRYALDQARQLAEKRNFPEAIRYYQRLLKAKPDDADLLIEAARVFGWADRNKESADLYQRVTKQFPARRNEVLAPLGAQLLWSNQASAAITIFEEQLARHPNDHDTAIHLGEALQAMEKYNEAIALYDGLLTKNAGDTPATRGKAWALLRTDRFPAAEKLFRGILKQTPNDADARIGLARTLNFSGRHQEAIRAYDQLAQDFPNDQGIKVQRATAQYWAGLESEALETLEPLISDDAEKLRTKIKRSQRPAVTSGVEFSKDKDDLKITRGQVSGKVPIGDTGSIGITYDRAELKGNRKARELTLSGSDINNLKLNGVTAIAARITSDTKVLNVDAPGGKSAHVPVDGGQQGNSFRTGNWNEPGRLTGQNLSFTYSDRAGSANGGYGLIFPSITLGVRDYDGWRSGLVRAGAKWLPADFWRIDFEAGNDIVENLDAIDNRVKLKFFSANVERTFSPRWLAGAGLFAGKFDDGNRRSRASGRIEYVATFAPRLSFGLEGLAFRDSKQAFRDVTLRFDNVSLIDAPALSGTGSVTFREAGRGYYNPKNYAEAKLFGAVSYDRDRWSLWGKLALGGLRETPFDEDSSSGIISSAELTYAFHVTPQSDLRASLSRSSSRLSSSEGGGYYRNLAGIYFNHWFDY